MRQTFLGSGKQRHWLILLLPALLIACDDDDDLTPEQARATMEVAAKDNSRIFAVTQEILDLTSMALLEKGVSGTRETTGGRIKDEVACYPTISASYDVKKSADSVVYAGTLTVDFDDGSSCADTASVMRGKITDEFRYVISYSDSIPFKAFETITFEDFEKDSVGINGTIVSVYDSDGTRSIDIDNAVLTYQDGTSATWNGALVYTYDDGGTPFKPVDDTRALSGTLNGTTREGANFTSSVTNDVVFSNKCGDKANIPVSGVVDFSTAGMNAVVDYGDGTCDTSYTITANGETTTHDFEPVNL